MRAYGKVPHNRGENTTPLASMTLEGVMGETMIMEGATDAMFFGAHVEHFSRTEHKGSHPALGPRRR
jgi:hypothetical protein